MKKEFNNIVEAIREAKAYGGKLVKREYKAKQGEASSKVEREIYKGKDGAYYMRITRDIKI